MVYWLLWWLLCGLVLFVALIAICLLGLCGFWLVVCWLFVGGVDLIVG